MESLHEKKDIRFGEFKQHLVPDMIPNSLWTILFNRIPLLFGTCEGEGDVVGVEAPLGGVAQVIFDGVQVVEVGLQVRVHQDRGVEEDGKYRSK